MADKSFLESKKYKNKKGTKDNISAIKSTRIQRNMIWSISTKDTINAYNINTIV